MRLPDRFGITPEIFGEIDPRERRIRMKLKREPGDVQIDIWFSLEFIDDTRADIAERSDEIRVDGDVE